VDLDQNELLLVFVGVGELGVGFVHRKPINKLSLGYLLYRYVRKEKEEE